MLSSRYQNDGRSIIPLRSKQRVAKRILLDRLRSSYAFHDRPCVCGSSNFDTLSEKDAFGIPHNVVICMQCGLIQVSPCLVQDSYADFYQNIYPDLYGDNNNLNSLFSDLLSRGSYIYEFIDGHVRGVERYLSSKKSILEIGCSAGGILEVFRQHGHDTVGIDYDSEVLCYGNSRGLNLYCGHSQQLGLEFNGRFDVIILSHVFEHFTDINGELKQINRLLKVDGRLFIEVPGIYSSLGETQSDFLDFIEFDHVYYFGLNTLEQTLRLFGFKMLAGNEASGQAVCAVFTKINGDQAESNRICDRSELLNYYEDNFARLQHLEGEYSRRRLRHLVIRQLKILPLRYKIKAKSIMYALGINAR